MAEAINYMFFIATFTLINNASREYFYFTKTNKHQINTEVKRVKEVA